MSVLLTDKELGRIKASPALYRQMWDDSYKLDENKFKYGIVEYERQVAKAQLKKLVGWEEEFCADHWARRANGTMKSRTPRRRFCGRCRQALLRECNE